MVFVERMAVEVTVPVGATGVLELPGLPAETLGHGTHRRETEVPVPVG